MHSSSTIVPLDTEWVELHVDLKNYIMHLEVASNSIKHKALKIFSALNENPQTLSTTEFSASKGWFENFKKRHNMHNVQLKGEVASGDEKSAKEYLEKLAKIIEETITFLAKYLMLMRPVYSGKNAQKNLFLKCVKSVGGFKAA